MKLYKALLKPEMASFYESIQSSAGEEGKKIGEKTTGMVQLRGMHPLQKKCSECALTTDEKMSATNTVGQGIGWWWQCHYSNCISKSSSCSVA